MAGVTDAWADIEVDSLMPVLSDGVRDALAARLDESAAPEPPAVGVKRSASATQPPEPLPAAVPVGVTVPELAAVVVATSRRVKPPWMTVRWPV